MRKRGIIIVMLGSILLCLASILCTYFGLLSIGVIPQNKIELSYEVSNKEKEYDGTSLYAEEYKLTSGELMMGHHAVFHTLSSLTDVGSTSILAEIEIQDAKGDNVSEYYTIRYTLGTLTVKKRSLGVKLPSVIDLSDSSLISEDQYEILSGSLLTGHKLYAKVDDSTSEGKVTFNPSLYVLDAFGHDVTSNYNISTTTENQTVDLTNITIKPQDISLEYSREYVLPQTVEVAEGVLKRGHRIVAEFADVEAMDVGQYTTQISEYKIYDSSDKDVTKLYKVKLSAGRIHISKRHLTITTSTFTSQYKARGISTTERMEPTIEGLLDGDSVTYVYDTGTIIRNCGTYRNTIDPTTVHVVNNAMDVTDVYEVNVVEGEITITPAPITVQWGSLNLTYNAQNQFPVYQLVGELTGDIVNLIYYTNRNAGSYNTNLALDNTNYYLDNSSMIEYTIAPAPISVVPVNNHLTYSGEFQAPELNIHGVYAEDEGFCNVSVGIQKNCGVYEESVQLDNANYYLNESSISYTITPIAATLSSPTTNLTYTGEYQSPELVVGTVGPDDICKAIIKSYKNCGEYSEIVQLDNANYYLENPNFVYTISPVQIDVSTANENLTYTGSPQTPSLEILGLIGNDTCDVQVESFTDCGSYTARIVVNNPNYYSSSTTLDYTISPYEISCVWSSKSFVYTGEYQYPTVTNSENYPIRYEGQGKNAGTHIVTAHIDNPNYVLMDESTSYVITPKKITATLDSKVLLYNGKYQAPEVTFTGLCASDTCVYTTVKNKYSNNYTLKITLCNENYEIDEASDLKYMIVEREITVMAVSITKTDDGLPLYGQFVIVSGSLAEGDSLLTYDMTISLEGVGEHIYDGMDATIYGYDKDGYPEEVTDNYIIVGIEGILTIL